MKDFYTINKEETLTEEEAKKRFPDEFKMMKILENTKTLFNNLNIN